MNLTILPKSSAYSVPGHLEQNICWFDSLYLSSLYKTGYEKGEYALLICGEEAGCCEHECLVASLTCIFRHTDNLFCIYTFQSNQIQGFWIWI